MGTYNWQECMTKEINFLNELLLDGDVLGKNTMNNNNLVSPKVSIKESKENLLKALNKANLSADEKKYYENFINEHPNSVINLGQNNNIINGNDNYEQSNEIKNIEEDEYLEMQGENKEGGQNYFYQMDQQKMLEQERLMDEYKQQQLLMLKKEENELKAEEEELKKQIEKAQNEERMLEESNHFQELKIETLEPQKIVLNKDEEQQIKIKKDQYQNSNEKEKLGNKRKVNKNSNRKRNINNSKESNNNTQNIKTEIIKQERVIRNVFNLEEQKAQKNPIVLRTKEQYMKQIEQMTQNNNEESGETEENKEEEPDAEEKEDSNDARKEMNNDMKINENEHFIYSQKFKTETYEPGEEKNDYLDDNEDYNVKNNNNDDFGPKDNKKKGSISQRGNNNMNNDNYKFNMLKHSPKDNRGSFKVSKNMESVDGIGPRDSRRKEFIKSKFNSYYPKMNLTLQNQIKPTMYQEMPYNNYKSKEQFNNTANPKSHQQQNNFIKREVLSSSSSQRSFQNKKGKFSPLFNQIQNEQNYQ
jgi:hypothetical protein